MSVLKDLISVQTQTGIQLNMGAIRSLPLNKLKSDALSHPIMQGRQSLMLDPAKRAVLCANFLNQTRKYCFNNAGVLSADYAHLLIAYWSIIRVARFDAIERQLLEVMIRYIGAEQLESQLKVMLSYAKGGRLQPRFMTINGMHTAKQGDILCSQLMSLLIQPKSQSSICYVADIDELVYGSFLLDVMGMSEQKAAKFLKTRDKSLWIPNCAFNLEKRLAPKILRGDFGNLSTRATEAYVKYQSGELLPGRQGLKGRKPHTEFPFLERMYPTLQGVLDSWLDELLHIPENAGLPSDILDIYYVCPYFFCYAVPHKYQGLFKEFRKKTHATMVKPFTERTFLRGAYL